MNGTLTICEEFCDTMAYALVFQQVHRLKFKNYVGLICMYYLYIFIQISVGIESFMYRVCDLYFLVFHH